MTKQELMETYTAEQLAEMVVKLQSGKERKTFKVSDNKNYQKELEEFLKESPFQNTIEKICKDITYQKDNAMAMEFARVICGLLRENGVYVRCTETKFGEKITHNSIEEKYGIKFDSMDFSEHDKEFTGEIEKLQSEVEKYCKAFEDAKKERDFQTVEYQNKIDKLKQKLERQETATKYAEEYVDGLKNDFDRSKNTINQIDDILEKLFGVRHDTVDKPDEFEKILTDKVKGNATDFLPTEPIKVADMLINAEGEYEHSPIEKALYKEDKGTYRIFGVSELRQIAEHLLIYCNHNKEVEE